MPDDEISDEDKLTAERVRAHADAIERAYARYDLTGVERALTQHELADAPLAEIDHLIEQRARDRGWKRFNS